MTPTQQVNCILKNMITHRGLISVTNSDTVGSLPDESEISTGAFDVVPFVTPLGHSLVFFY